LDWPTLTTDRQVPVFISEESWAENGLASALAFHRTYASGAREIYVDPALTNTVSLLEITLLHELMHGGQDDSKVSNPVFNDECTAMDYLKLDLQSLKTSVRVAEIKTQVAHGELLRSTFLDEVSDARFYETHISAGISQFSDLAEDCFSKWEVESIQTLSDDELEAQLDLIGIYREQLYNSDSNELNLFTLKNINRRLDARITARNAGVPYGMSPIEKEANSFLEEAKAIHKHHRGLEQKFEKHITEGNVPDLEAYVAMFQKIPSFWNIHGSAYTSLISAVADNNGILKSLVVAFESESEETETIAASTYTSSKKEMCPRIAELGYFYFLQTGDWINTKKEANKAYALFMDPEVNTGVFQKTREELENVEAIFREQQRLPEALGQIYSRAIGL
jgi:hypothetical protein